MKHEPAHDALIVYSEGDRTMSELSENITKLAQEQNKPELDIINDLLAGASAVGNKKMIDALLTIRKPLIDAKIAAILNR
jgi:hypothetical protein